ncbi:MAG: MFS transporter [Nocardioidaceae bacterium]
MRAAFAQRRFRILFGGIVASQLGDSVMLLVLSIWVKNLTGSNAAAGFTFFWLVLPSLAAPLLGWGVDKVARRTFLVVGNLASALVLLPLFLVHDSRHVWVIYAVAVGYGISFVTLPAALNGMLKHLLPDDQLIDANAAIATTREGLRLGGPLLGAGLYTAFGPSVVVSIDIVSFLVAAAAVLALRVDTDVVEVSTLAWKDEVLAGIRHIGRDRVLKHSLIAIGIAICVIGFTESCIYAVLDAFHKTASFVGVISTVQGVGAVLAGLMTSRLVKRRGEVSVMLAGLLICTVGLAIMVAAKSIFMVLASVFVFGLALPPIIIGLTTLMQVRTPQALMGRVSAAFDVILGTPQSLSIAVGALMVSVVSFRVIFAIMAGAFALSAIYLRFSVGGRDRGLPPPRVPATAESVSPVHEPLMPDGPLPG